MEVCHIGKSSTINETSSWYSLIDISDEHTIFHGCLSF